MPRRSLAILFAATILAQQGSLQADSLWDRRSRSRAFLFYDCPMYEVGDILYIVIDESTDVDNRETRAMKKETAASEGFNFDSSTGGGLGDQGASAELAVSNETNREFDGEAAFRSEQEFTDRVAVSVRELLPNGNLLVAGNRGIMVDGDQRTLLLSGTVRRQDIRPDGTINSRSVANLRMRYVGRGPNQSFIRQGWFGRAMNRIWPF